jgi:hypothetical protein
MAWRKGGLGKRGVGSFIEVYSGDGCRKDVRTCLKSHRA